MAINKIIVPPKVEKWAREQRGTAWRPFLQEVWFLAQEGEIFCSECKRFHSIGHQMNVQIPQSYSNGTGEPITEPGDWDDPAPFTVKFEGPCCYCGETMEIGSAARLFTDEMKVTRRFHNTCWKAHHARYPNSFLLTDK